MNEKMKTDYWFAARPPRHGWGWGLPITWQGWVVFVGFFVCLVAGVLLILPHGGGYFGAYLVALIALLVLICMKKGEPLGKPFGPGA